MEEKDLSDLLVDDVFTEFVVEPTVVRSGEGINKAIDAMIANPVTRKVYIVDEAGRLVGMIRTETLLRLVGYRLGVRKEGPVSLLKFFRDALKDDINEVMEDAIGIRQDMPMTDALSLMINHHLNDLAVVDEDDRLVGELSSLELFIRVRELFP
jgi:CBS domain-containing protein